MKTLHESSGLVAPPVPGDIQRLTARLRSPQAYQNDPFARWLFRGRSRRETQHGRRQLGAVAPGMVDIQQIPLYDSYTAPVATLQTPPIQFFTVPIGSTGSGFAVAKSIVQTNLTQPQRLEAPRSFEVHALRLYFQQNIVFADVLSLFNSVVAVLIVGEKAYQQGPTWMFPAGGGVSGNPTIAGATNWQNGLVNPCAINLIAQPFLVKLEQGENFRVELQGTSGFTTATAAAGGTGIYVVAVLDGILTRQVQ